MINRVGGAFVAYQSNVEVHHQCFRLNNEATVYMAELTAIDKAIEMQHCQKAYHPQISSPTLDQSHKGHLGNERADELAKSATNLPNIDCFNKIEPQTIKNLIKNDIIQEWKDRWRHSQKGETFLLSSECKHQKGSGDFFLNQIITGHGTIGAYQTRLFDKDPSCVCGHSFEDRSHIIYDCPEWEKIRRRFFPPNHKEVNLQLLLANKKSRQGIRTCCKGNSKPCSDLLRIMNTNLST
ncbi:RNase H domain-containing protein [Caerostris extrusa]|uniref:RNase H domain-containing protein n=1 Tax=Caerostris extrusa TaxID=172846 RepID=A0AAV4N0G1_CAEEX|nr:RNase H domain-containing protein [Caerostris extrusa]